MKLKEKQQINNMQPADMVKEIHDLKKKVITMAVGRYTKQQKNVREMRSMKRRIAVLSTAMRQAEIAGKAK